jgi:hypothetical protein
MVKNNKKLRPYDRQLDHNLIPIIMFGTQLYPTVHGMTLFYYIIFTKSFGVYFLEELTRALIRYPVQYASKYSITDETNIYQRAVKIIFDINLIDKEIFPQNRFELFIQEDIVRQPLDILLSSNHEMVVGTTDVIPDFLSSLVDKKVTKLNKMFDYAPTNIIYSTRMIRGTTKIRFEHEKTENKIGLVYPYGLYKTNNISNLTFQKPIESRLSKTIKDIIHSTKEQNQKKQQMFKHPKTVTIGAIFVFCCKVSNKKIQNLQFPQEEEASHPIIDPIKLFYNPTTKKYQVKKVEKKDFSEFEENTAKKLNEIKSKRKQRKDGKKSITSQQYHLENLFG